MGRYAHARHSLPLAFWCSYCRMPIGMLCTSGNKFHVKRSGLVPEGMTDEQLDEVIGLLLDLKQARRGSDSDLVDELVQRITDVMVRIRNDVSVKV